jgi:hypothetical protein
MKFLRHLLGITKLDKEKNQCIREKTGAQNIVKEIKQYQEKWQQHIQRMDTNRMPKQALQCKTKGRRHIRRPKKRWRDQFHFEDTRNKNHIYSFLNMMMMMMMMMSVKYLTSYLSIVGAQTIRPR